MRAVVNLAVYAAAVCKSTGSTFANMRRFSRGVRAWCVEGAAAFRPSRHISRAAFVVFFAAWLAGCGSTAAVLEFQAYSQAFNSQFDQGETVLNSVAEAERKLGRSKIERQGGLTGPFKPENSAYLIDSVDPPITASVRASLKAVKSYNDALTALANGEAAAALSNRISTLAGNLVGAAAAASSAFGGAAAVPGGQKLISETTAALNIAGPIITTIATRAARESFREQLLQTYPTMRSLLVTLKDGTPVMYYVLYQSRVTRGSTARGGLATDAARAALEKDRQALAGWVVLLDRTLIAMDAANEAASNISFADQSAGLLEASNEVKALAEQIKKARAKQ
jgi:hypothetical protein